MVTYVLKPGIFFMLALKIYSLSDFIDQTLWEIFETDKVV